MKFSMNGFRRNLSNDVRELRDIVAAINNNQFYDKEDLVNAMNDVITHSNVVNCVYNPGDADFKDMSEIEVEHIE